MGYLLPFGYKYMFVDLRIISSFSKWLNGSHVPTSDTLKVVNWAKSLCSHYVLSNVRTNYLDSFLLSWLILVFKLTILVPIDNFLYSTWILSPKLQLTMLRLNFNWFRFSVKIPEIMWIICELWLIFMPKFIFLKC